MAEYRFLTTWLLDAELEPVWLAIEDAERWPEWWPGVLRSDKVREGDERGVGTVIDAKWRSVIPYPVRFRAEVIRSERPHTIEVVAAGELEGSGTWRLYASGEGVAVTYDWRVQTTRAWMNAVAPVARPVFAWNHHWIMRRGGEGLARRVGGRLLAAS